MTAGTFGFQRLFSAGSQALGDGALLAAVEIQHYDGPFVTPDDRAQGKRGAALQRGR